MWMNAKTVFVRPTLTAATLTVVTHVFAMKASPMWQVFVKVKYQNKAQFSFKLA